MMQETFKESVIVIGVDALDIELVRTWAKQGHLPNFCKLFETSCWGMIENPKGVEAGSVWPTFTTGYRPDHHGLFNAHYRFDLRDYRLRIIEKQERSVPPIWVDLSSAGKRVAVVDVPYELLEDQINGVQVTDWLPHVFNRYPGPSTHPAELAADLVNRFGGNPFEGPNRCPTNEVSVETVEQIVSFRDKLVDRVKRKLLFCQELLGQERWDYFAAVFHEAHEVGHMCWHIHDRNHEHHDSSIAEQVGDPILDVYQAIDDAIGVLLRSVWDGAKVLVYLSHGIGPQRTGTGLIDDVLEKLQEAYESESASLVNRTPGNSRSLGMLANWYRTLVPDVIRRQALKMNVTKKLYTQLNTERLRNRPFFALNPNHATGGIRINLKGREEFGLVEPGEEYEQLCERLARDLEELINTDTNERVVETSVQINQLYDGPRTSFLPDVLLEWNKSAPINRVQSPKIGVVERRIFGARTGDHVQKRGAFFAVGPGIASGERATAVKTVDFASTIAAMFDLQRAYHGNPIVEFGVENSRNAVVEGN